MSPIGPISMFCYPQILHSIDYTHAAAAEGHRSLILQCVINVSYCLAAGCRRHKGLEANIDTAARTIVRSVHNFYVVYTVRRLSIVSILVSFSPTILTRSILVSLSPAIAVVGVTIHDDDG